MRSRKFSKYYRIIFLSLVMSFVFTIPAQAYLDPSVMTYAIQAISGIVIALGTFGGLAYRKLKNRFFKGNTSKIIETNDFYHNDSLNGVSYSLDVEEHNNEIFDYSKYNEENSPPSLKKRFKKSILLCFTTAFTIFFFSPTLILLTNYGELKNSSGKLLPIVVVVAIIMFIVLLLVHILFKNKSYYLVFALLFAICLGAFIQSLFINPKFPPINGGEIPWEWYTKATVLSVGVWFVIIVGSLYAMIKKPKETIVIKNVICVLIVLIEVLSLIYTSISTKEERSRNPIVVTKNNQFDLSSNKNTVVFVVDTLDALWAEKYMLQDEGYLEYFKDFTYFDDVVSGGAPTVLGMPAMLTGQLYNPKEETKEEYYERVYSETNIFKLIHDQGWGQKYYTHLSYLECGDIQYIDNVIEGEYVVTQVAPLAKELYKLVAFNTMPMPLKRFFWNTQNVLQNYIVPKGGWEEYSTEDDPQLYQDMLAHPMTTNSDKNLFVMYHMFGAHGPYYMDENALRIPVEHSRDYLEGQIRGTIKIIQTFIDEMKENNIYDSSTIIITADHGGENVYPNPAVFIKKPNETHDEMIVDDTKLSFQNLYATYMSSITDEDVVPYDDFYESEGEEIRYHTASETLAKLVVDESKVTLPYMRFIIKGRARDFMKDIQLSDD